MYYRIYQDNNAFYPGWGYNLTFKELNQMAIWWLSSLVENETILNDEFEAKLKALNGILSEEGLISEVESLGMYDGGLKVEKSEHLFDLSELGYGEEVSRPWND